MQFTFATVEGQQQLSAGTQDAVHFSQSSCHIFSFDISGNQSVRLVLVQFGARNATPLRNFASSFAHFAVPVGWSRRRERKKRAKDRQVNCTTTVR
jgi:hypothetical protein